MFLCAMYLEKRIPLKKGVNPSRGVFLPQEGLLLKTDECIPHLNYTTILGPTVKNVVMH